MMIVSIDIPLSAGREVTHDRNLRLHKFILPGNVYGSIIVSAQLSREKLGKKAGFGGESRCTPALTPKSGYPPRRIPLSQFFLFLLKTN
jgi:hypothetical protein